MHKYFFHLVDSSEVVLDPEGVFLPINAIADTALLQARDCMAGDVKDGKLRLDYQINVHDEQGALVHSLSFADAIEIVSPHPHTASQVQKFG